ncbi:MAG: hypothetical protein RI563_08695 [Thiohalophilus sp.]|uniref:hypothetical protein n=1 Tax=Thiohalophilus sp. TaxID=3028392 RepID=UPI00286FCC05|nr:hypothetical protein [Thiohalophilus sp.]MDR9436947.1 hypothetical protein [Thiohalophilus sp.]
MTTENEATLGNLDRNDIEGLVEIANLVAAARDAMSDEIVTRIAGTMSEGLTLLDRLTRNEGLMRLLQVLDKPESQNLLIALSEAIHATSQEIAAAPPATGGFGCMVRVAKDPGTQEGIRLLSLIGKHMSHSLREQHHKGGNPA